MSQLPPPELNNEEEEFQGTCTTYTTSSGTSPQPPPYDIAAGKGFGPARGCANDSQWEGRCGVFEREGESFLLRPFAMYFVMPPFWNESF
jgi:hypothetical protein